MEKLSISDLSGFLTGALEHLLKSWLSPWMQDNNSVYLTRLLWCLHDLFDAHKMFNRVQELSKYGPTSLHFPWLFGKLTQLWPFGLLLVKRHEWDIPGKYPKDDQAGRSYGADITQDISNKQHWVRDDQWGEYNWWKTRSEYFTWVIWVL